MFREKGSVLFSKDIYVSPPLSVSIVYPLKTKGEGKGWKGGEHENTYTWEHSVSR